MSTPQIENNCLTCKYLSYSDISDGWYSCQCPIPAMPACIVSDPRVRWNINSRAPYVNCPTWEARPGTPVALPYATPQHMAGCALLADMTRIYGCTCGLKANTSTSLLMGQTQVVGCLDTTHASKVAVSPVGVPATSPPGKT